MLFFSLTSSFHILLLCFYFSAILLAKFFGSLWWRAISKRINDGDETDCHEEDECIDNEDWESAGDGSPSNLYEEDLGFITFECTKNGHLVANTICSREAQLLLPIQIPQKDQILAQQGLDHDQSFRGESLEDLVKESFSHHSKPSRRNFKENIRNEDANSVTASLLDTDERGSEDSISSSGGDVDKGSDNLNVGKNFLEEDEHFYSLSPAKLKSHNVKTLEVHEEEALEDSFTVGSTSKSSSEWRISRQCRDSVSEDPFSSSSRRSCPTWESYTAFQKYDEEMTFYDQISAQKLHETKLQKGVEVLQRSMSQKIVQKFTRRSKKSPGFQRSPYHELEAAYVGQICLAWEALSLNYKNFLRLRALQGEDDPGCPAHIAQQFQQFQVLLQRFIENEPYEHGRRPEVYAKIRIASPKLLQVPEFRGIDETEKDQKEEAWSTYISSFKFTTIMERGIRTFMDFLKADRDKHCVIFKALIRRNNKNCIGDPTLHHLLKKTNEKKKKKITDIGRVRKCLRKAVAREEEMEMLMGLIDLKVVSRVLKMSEISEEQLQWCEAKMSKVRFWEGKLQRDSSPLFFPLLSSP